MAEESGPGYLRGVITGLLLGVVTALLLAPKPGGQLRQDLAGGASKLKDKASDLGGSVAETAQDLKERGGELLANARSQDNNALEAGTHYVQDAKENVRGKGQDRAANAHDQANEARDKTHDVVESV